MILRDIEKLTTFTFNDGSKAKVHIHTDKKDGRMIDISYKKPNGKWFFAFGVPVTAQNVAIAEDLALGNAEIYLKGEYNDNI